MYKLIFIHKKNIYIYTYIYICNVRGPTYINLFQKTRKVYLRISRAMFRTIWEKCLKQCRSSDFRKQKVYQDIAPGADGQTIYMLARARLENVQCDCLRVAQDLATHHKHLQVMSS